MGQFSDDLMKATIIDGVAATEDRDSQNEVLALPGADISQMVGKGYFNDNHGSGFINTLGRITEAKKILSEQDATNARQKHYWKEYKRPFLYVKGYLFDDEEHPNAKAVAAIMRSFKKMGTPLDVKLSVEGKVVNRDIRDRGLLKESAIRNVALTLVPANNKTGSQIIGKTIQKSIMDHVERAGGNVEYADNLMKSMGYQVVDDSQFIQNRFTANILEIGNLVKALSAGHGAAGAPSSMAGGAPLIKESLGKLKSMSPAEQQQILKSFIKGVRINNPEMPLSKAIELALNIFNKYR